MTDKLRDSRGGESPPNGPSDAPVADARDAYVTVLFNRYRGALHRYLSRLVATSDVPDLVQETYYRVLRHENVVEIDALARGLLFQTATNLARDHRRRDVSRHSLQHVPIEETTEPGTLDGPEERLANEQTLQLIERTLAKLPSETRAVFVLSRFKELSYPEIARAMGLSARTVARKMSEALDALASAVGKVT